MAFLISAGFFQSISAISDELESGLAMTQVFLDANPLRTKRVESQFRLFGFGEILLEL